MPCHFSPPSVTSHGEFCSCSQAYAGSYALVFLVWRNVDCSYCYIRWRLAPASVSSLAILYCLHLRLIDPIRSVCLRFDLLTTMPVHERAV